MFYYETHLHTCQASACGVADGRDYIDYMSGLGYSGIVVTDHFFNGNSCVPRDLSWPDRIDMYCSGYEAAKNAAVGKDFSVFFGIEYNFDGDEFLLYGLDKKWLLDRPEILSASRHEVYHEVHSSGGLMIQAHPYRERDYLSAIHLTPSACDGCEIYNAANSPYMNALAHEYAVKNSMLMTAGSDIHYFHDKEKGALGFDHKLTSYAEFLKGIREKTAVPYSRRSNGIFIPVEDIPEQVTVTKAPYLTVFMH